MNNLVFQKGGYQKLCHRTNLDLVRKVIKTSKKRDKIIITAHIPFLTFPVA